MGYCQGMNFIAAMLLQHLNEEEAFWVLCQIIEYMLPLDYYITMNGVVVDQRLLEYLIKDKFSSIAKHFRKIEFDCQAIVFQWFVCLFANSLPFDIVANIWDQFFTKGIVAIFQYALGILEVLKKKILATKDLGALFIMLRSLPENVGSWKHLNQAAKKHKITWETIKTKRAFLRPHVYEEYEEQHRKKSSDFNIRNSIGKFLSYLEPFNTVL